MTLPKQKTRFNVLKKRWVKICSAIVLAVVVLFLLLPVGAKYYLINWLEKNGADSAAIEKFRYNPFLGRITVTGLDVQTGGKSLLNHSSMVLDFGITSLLKHDIRLEKVEYRGVSIDLEQYADGRWRFASYTMAGGTDEAGKAIVKPGDDTASAWAFRADQVELENCRVHFKTPDLDMTLVIEQAELIKFTTREWQPAGKFTFNGQLDDGHISLQLDSVQIIPDLRIVGNASLSRFKLDELSKLLSEALPSFAGEVSFNGKIDFSQVAEKGITADYDGTIEVARMDIGNGDFSAKSENLKWDGKVLYQGLKDTPVSIETDGLLAAREFSLAVLGAELAAKESRIDLAGKTTVTLAENIIVENNGSLLMEGIELGIPFYDISEESLLWKGKVLYDSDHDKEGPFVRTEGSLDLGTFRFEGGEQPATIASGGDVVSWKGMFTFAQQSFGQRMLVDGVLSGSELQATIAEPQLHFTQGKIALGINSTTISLGEHLDINGSSSLELEQFRLSQGQNENLHVVIEKIAVAELDGRGKKTIVAKDVLTTGLKMSVPGNFPLDITISEIHLSDLSTDDLATFSLAELGLKNPLITALHNNRELVRLDDLVVNNITVNDGVQIRAENINLDSLIFLKSPDDSVKKAALTLGSATLSEMNWSAETGLRGDAFYFDDLVATIIRDKDGNINISQELGKMQLQSQVQEVEVPATDAEGSQGAPFRIKEVVVGGDSNIFFEDYTLAVPFVTDLVISRFEITDLDSSQPDKETNITLLGEFENRAPLEVTGHISLFKEKPALKMKIKLKNYPLSSLSAYTVQSVGTALASGQLKLKSKIALADDKLDMKNTIVLKKLETETISPELAAELDNELPIPLNAALSLLRDNKRNITLDIPLKGPLSELDVGISDVLITGLSKAIIPAASGYLVYALGPYAALAYVGMKVGEKMLQVDLPPVVFMQQEAELTADHIKYLERIAKILNDRPETDLQLCPRVASWELLTDQEKAAAQGDMVEVDEKNRDNLIQLGQQRAAAVQNHLASDYSIDHDRLLICDTRIEKEKNSVPAVLLQL